MLLPTNHWWDQTCHCLSQSSVSQVKNAKIFPLTLPTIPSKLYRPLLKRVLKVFTSGAKCHGVINCPGSCTDLSMLSIFGGGGECWWCGCNGSSTVCTKLPKKSNCGQHMNNFEQNNTVILFSSPKASWSCLSWWHLLFCDYESKMFTDAAIPPLTPTPINLTGESKKISWLMACSRIQMQVFSHLRLVCINKSRLFSMLYRILHKTCQYITFIKKVNDIVDDEHGQCWRDFEYLVIENKKVWMIICE